MYLRSKFLHILVTSVNIKCDSVYETKVELKAINNFLIFSVLFNFSIFRFSVVIQ